jgi:hypothetical protein
VVFYSQTSTGKIVSMSVHCCDRIDSDLNYRCDKHPNRDDCPDAFVKVVQDFLIVHDGGSSGVEINFCPWCGKKCRGVNASCIAARIRRSPY